MAANNFTSFSRSTPRATPFSAPSPLKHLVLVPTNGRNDCCYRIKVSNSNGESYLDMWKNAVEREKKSLEFQNMGTEIREDSGSTNTKDYEKKTEDFEKIIEYSRDERDRIQRMQVVDRAAAAIAAARALLQETQSLKSDVDSSADVTVDDVESTGGRGGTRNGIVFVPRSETSGNGVPGPDFWSWTPPPDTRTQDDFDVLEPKKSVKSPVPKTNVTMKERSLSYLDIPLQSKLSTSNIDHSLPPWQSLMEVQKEEVSESSLEMPSLKDEERKHDLASIEHAIEVGFVLADKEDEACSGVDPNGLRWWKETGTERRPDGVVCRWTMIRGVSADQDVEWQEKFWEASDVFGYKELGSEKSGRDASGNVWREFWRESMWQENGLAQFEKTADKWGKNGQGDEWQEKWWEHYDASNKAEKWAHKWCTIDPTTPLEAGHAHVWHERWGETYDGHGGSTKYTDKWAERCEGDGWSKWGDKWDEHFDQNGHGVKQGEKWWEGKHGERWNRTWGEGHNGSGWVHKYGKSSSGEHWDTHVQQETWYERFPHFGFYHCFENSGILREVQVPSESSDASEP